MFHAFSSFAVRNDAWSRRLFGDFAAALESRPLLCWLSTVSDIAAFFNVAARANVSTCQFLVEERLERDHFVHLGSQGAKSDRKSVVDIFIPAVDAESRACGT